MTVAASVTTTIVIKGNDQASKSIKKSQTAMDKLRGSMTKAQAKSKALGGSLRSLASGDVLGALSGLSGMLGSGGGGLALAAGAATTATAALAVGVGVAAYKFTEWSSEIERTRAALDNTFGGDGVEKAISFAREIGGVGVDSVQKLATTLKASGVNATVTAEQMKELANRATQMGKSGDEGLTAFAEAIRGGEAGALKMVGVFINGEVAVKNYATAHGLMAERMTATQRSAAVLAASLEDLSNKTGASSKEYSRQDEVLARLSISWSELKFTMSEYLSGPAAGVLESVADTIDAFDGLGKVIGASLNLAVVDASLIFRKLGTLLAGATAMALEAASGNMKGARAVMKQMDADMARIDQDRLNAIARLDAALAGTSRAAKVVVKEISFVGNALNYLNNASAQFSAGITKRAAMEGALAAARAKRAAKAAAWAAKALAARKKALADDLAFFAELESVKTAAASADVERKRSEIAATTARNNSLRTMVDLENQAAQIKAAGDPVAIAHLQNLQTELDLQKRIAEIKANMSLDAGEQQRTIDAVRGIAHSKEMANIKAATDAQRAATQATIQGYLATGNAAAGALAEIGVAERAIAGIKAIMAGAEAFLAFARYDYAAGIAATTAAIQFGRIALTSPDVPAGAASAPSIAPTGIASPSASGEGGAATYNISINGVFATAAETGAAIKQAISAASGSGMKSAA